MITLYKGKEYIDYIKFDGIKKDHKQHIRNCLLNYGKEIQQELYKVITTGSRSGRGYWFRGTLHIASAPGEPPANRSGRLANSFEYKVGTYDLVVGSDLNYAKFLEEGTVKMKPRPYFEITNINNKYKLDRDLNGFQPK